MPIEGDRRIAVVIVNYRTADLAIQCVRSLQSEATANPSLRVMLVDNASGDGSPERLRQGLADLITSGFVEVVPLALNGGFGWGNNQAILRLVQGATPPDYILLLNPDCEASPGAIERLARELDAHSDCAVAGAQLLDPDGTLSGSAFRAHGIGTEFVRGARLPRLHGLLGIRPVLVESAAPVAVDWVTGAASMVRVAALRDSGLFDDGFFLYFEEVELMHRIRQAGWTIRHVPDARVMHIGGVSTGVGQDKPEAKPGYPSYWYRSRRRYFVRTRGAAVAKAASIAWLAGDALARIVGLVVPGRRDPSGGAERRQLLDSGIRPVRDDGTAHVVRLEDPVDTPPAWMAFESAR